MKKIRKYCAVTILSLLLPLAAQAAVTGSINGSVKAAGGPVAGARIVVDSSGDSSFSGSATTLADGSFVVVDAPVGIVQVKAYDKEGKMLGSAKGDLKHQGDVLAITLTVTP